MTDPAEFEEFMRAYQNMVFTVAMRLLGREADASDIAQEAFVKAYEHFDDLRNNPAAGGWLKRVCTNLALNHLSRYRARWRFFSELFTQDNPEAVDSLIEKAKSIGADGLDLQDKAPLDAAAIARIKAAGLGAYAWTIDDPAKAKSLIEWGIEGITTNRCAWLREQCGQPAK